MLKRAKILLVIILIAATIPFIIREIDLIKMELLEKETLRIYEKLKDNQASYNSYKELIVSNDFKIGDDKFSSKASGTVFISKNDIIFFIERFDKCAMKTNISRDLILVDKKCPKYKLVKGIINLITEEGEGLYIDNDTYQYKGLNVNNYLTFYEETWRIISYNSDGTVKIIRDTPVEDVENKNISSYLNDLSSKYYTPLSVDWPNGKTTLIPDMSYSDIEKSEQQDLYKSKVGILTLSDYFKTQVETCSIEIDIAICKNESFINKTMWLANANDNNQYYLYKDGNVYNDSLDGIKDIYPVLVIDSDFQIASGDGTKTNHYQLK